MNCSVFDNGLLKEFENKWTERVKNSDLKKK